MQLKNKFLGFTLAEVLITLGVVGVVAALTIPTLIHNYRAKEMRTRMLRANSIIQNGIGRMVADEINIEDVMNNKDTTTIRKYFKDGGCVVPRDKVEGNYYNYYGTSPAGGSAQHIKWPPYCLSDGMLLWFADLYDYDTNLGKDNYGRDTGYTILIVDINGWKNPPDKWGKDVFSWFYNPNDSRLHPFGPSAKYILNNIVRPYLYLCPGSKTASESGIGCTENAINDEAYFKKLKF